MADFDCIAATGRSLERLLNAAFLDVKPVPNKTTQAVVVRTDDLDSSKPGSVIQPPALSILLYRVDFNKTTRAAWSAVASHDGRARLPLDLHFLLTPWAENADYEHRILGCAIQRLESTPILSGPLLDPDGSWSVGDALQVALEEISTENLMRLFDTLPSDYKLSVAYVVRLVRLDERKANPEPPVLSVTAKVGG